MHVEDVEIVQQRGLYRAVCLRCNGFIGASADNVILHILIEAHRCDEAPVHQTPRPTPAGE